MAAKKVGALIKSARTDAGFTQEQLAKKVAGLSAADISKAERGEAELTQEQLKAIAKATGVTQKSLLDAAGSKTAAKATTAAKPAAAKKPAATKSTAAKKPAAAKSTASSGTSMKVTAAEKKLVELYRAADSDTKKSVLKLLKGEESDAGELLSSLLDTVVSQVAKK